MKLKDIIVNNVYSKILKRKNITIYKIVLEIIDNIVTYEEFNNYDGIRLRQTIDLKLFARWAKLKCDNWVLYNINDLRIDPKICKRCNCKIDLYNTQVYYKNELNKIVLCENCIEFKNQYE